MFLGFISMEAQTPLSKKETFTRQDTLRGSITPKREWWDLTYYHLDVKVDPDKKFINGKTSVHYKVLKAYNILQIDLQEPLKITKALQNGQELEIKHDGNAHFISLKKPQNVGTINSVDVYYEGHFSNGKVFCIVSWFFIIWQHLKLQPFVTFIQTHASERQT